MGLLPRPVLPGPIVTRTLDSFPSCRASASVQGAGAWPLPCQGDQLVPGISPLDSPSKICLAPAPHRERLAGTGRSGSLRAISSEPPDREDQQSSISWSSGVGAERGGDADDPGGAQQADGEVTAGGEGLGDSADPHLGTVLVEGDVAHVVEAVLDALVAAGQGEECLGVGSLGRQAGDVVADVGLAGDDLAASDLEPMALDGRELAEVRPGRPVRAGAADVGVLLGVREGPSTRGAHAGRGGPSVWPPGTN